MKDSVLTFRQFLLCVPWVRDWVFVEVLGVPDSYEGYITELHKELLATTAAIKGILSTSKHDSAIEEWLIGFHYR